MSYLPVDHGTRKAEGVTMVARFAERVAELLHRPVHVAFVDVLGPTPQEGSTCPPTSLRAVTGR